MPPLPQKHPKLKPKILKTQKTPKTNKTSKNQLLYLTEYG